MQYNPEEIFSESYEEWRWRRINATLAHYGVDFFKGKTLLEVGAGYGNVGSEFAIRYGAIVTCSDARPEHVAVMNKRHPYITAVVQDLEKEWPFTTPFDIIIHWGVLYHQHPDSIESSLTTAAQSCTHLILETEVTDIDDPNYNVGAEEVEWWDQAYHLVGSRPSPAYVERIITNAGMTFERVTDDRCNSGIHTYDWVANNNGNYKQGLRRFWFCKKVLEQ